MLEILGQHFLSPIEPAFYDANSKSYLELIANFHAKLNECVTEINTFTESMNNQMDEFLVADEKAKQEHMTAIRQEYQDFIDVINLKVMELENQIDNAEEYMRTNIIATTESIVVNALKNQDFKVDLDYDEENEELNFTIVEG